MKKIDRKNNCETLNESYHFNVSDFKDKEFFIYAELFLNDLKMNSELEDVSLNHALLLSLKIIPSIFRDQILSTLSREKLYSILNENSSTMRSVDCRYLILFIYYLIA